MSEKPAIEWILLDRQFVGIIYETKMFLAKYLPSVIGANYADRAIPKRIFLFNNVDEPLRLEKMIDELFDTPRRYEEDQRNQKIENLKKYFDRKKEESEMLKRALEKVPGWRGYEADQS